MRKSIYLLVALSFLPVIASNADDLSQVIAPKHRKSVSSADASREVPQSVRDEVQCMLKVLKTEPNVDNVESGYSNSDGWIHHPFIQYRYQEKNGAFGSVRFDTKQTHDSKHTVFFIAILNGLYSSDQNGPLNWGTGEITKRWKLSCGVNAEVLYD